MEDLKGFEEDTSLMDEMDAARAEKMEILSEAMRRNQPDFEDFLGYNGYSDRMIEADKERLERKMEEIRVRDEGAPEDAAKSDEYSKSAEPVLTYILGDVRFLANRGQRTFSFLASEYDDKMNGTDVVLGVEKPDGSEFLGFAVDVATGVDEQNIRKKIASSAMERQDRGAFTAFVKYCKWGEWRWKGAGARC